MRYFNTGEVSQTMCEISLPLGEIKCDILYLGLGNSNWVKQICRCLCLSLRGHIDVVNCTTNN